MWRTVTAALTSVSFVTGCGLGQPRLISPEGRLADCDTSACVSSLATDPDRRVAPLAYEGSRESARLALIRILAALPDARLVLQTEDYLHVEFRSRLMRYVDDLELLLPAAQPRIELRSASRLGYTDFGVNRARVETLRAQFEAVQP